MSNEVKFPWNELSPEDAEACHMDQMLYGMAFADTNEDGSKRRLAPEDWPEEVRPGLEALKRIWGQK